MEYKSNTLKVPGGRFITYLAGKNDTYTVTNYVILWVENENVVRHRLTTKVLDMTNPNDREKLLSVTITIKAITSDSITISGAHGEQIIPLAQIEEIFTNDIPSTIFLATSTCTLGQYSISKENRNKLIRCQEKLC